MCSEIFVPIIKSWILLLLAILLPLAEFIVKIIEELSPTLSNQETLILGLSTKWLTKFRSN